jgi:hypothetical protein
VKEKEGKIADILSTQNTSRSERLKKQAALLERFLKLSNDEIKSKK